MPPSHHTLVELEKKFWQSMLDQDIETSVALLHEPALVVGAHGATQFDHDGYRKMARQGPRVLTSFDLSDIQVVFPNDTTAIVTYGVKQGVAARGDNEGTTEEMADSSTWIQTDQGWRCVMHTETPVDKTRTQH